MVILSHRSCLKENPEYIIIVAPFSYNDSKPRCNIHLVLLKYIRESFIFCLYIFFFYKIIFHSYKSDLRQMKISDKNMKVCILVYFRFILPLALKALFLVCEGILVGMIDLYN